MPRNESLQGRHSLLTLPILAGGLLLASLFVGETLSRAIAAPMAPEPAVDVGAVDVSPEATVAAAVLSPINERYADAAAAGRETPDFQRHVAPLLGRLGCNGRACHGSFQGQGGFRLSLFGYDLKADHDSLADPTKNRIDTRNPGASLILRKPTLAEDHEGGKRIEADSWAYRVLERWIAAGAKGALAPQARQSARFVRLVVSPAEVSFQKSGETTSLRAIAEWSDGSREDVTPLCRFRTNDESIADVDERGVVSSKGPGGTHVVAFYDNGVTPVQVVRPVSEFVGNRYPIVPTPTKIDELVVAHLRKLGIVPSDLSTDAEFLRRVTLDITGTLPTPAEVEAFLADPSADKRRRKIDELLSSPGYVAWWTTKLCDITGNNPRRSAEPQLGDAQTRQWYAWISRRVQENMPYDKLVEGIVMATSRAPGQSYVDYCKEMSSYFRKDQPADFSARPTMPYFWSRGRDGAQAKEKAMAFSYAFLGVRLQCAECHKHPFDQWTKDDFDQFTAFFQPVAYGTPPKDRGEFQKMMDSVTGGQKGGQAQRKLAEAVTRGDLIPWREVFVATDPRGRPIALNRPAAGEKPAKGPNKGKNRRPASRVVTPKLLGDEQVELAAYEDPRAELMTWMREHDNPYFARAFVNRVWASYFNVGIVEPPDDLNLANPPSNEPLLDYLTEMFVASGYDMKRLHREIADSRTYQLSWKVNETNRLDERNFSHAVLRRLPAEVAYDAVMQATANDEQVASLRNDFTRRAIGPSSAVQRGNPTQFALRVFGKPERETNCDCERNVEPSLLQALFLRNDQDVLRMIDRSDGWVSQATRQLGEPQRANVARGERRDAQGGKQEEQKKAAPQQAGKDQRDIREIRREIVAAQARLAKFREEGNKERAERASRRIERLQAELRTAQAPGLLKQANPEARPQAVADKNAKNASDAKGADAQAAVEKAGIGEVIRSAYLRTLSRPPSAEEEQRLRRHIAANGKTAGLRDLIWALVNSKEFMLNH